MVLKERSFCVLLTLATSLGSCSNQEFAGSGQSSLGGDGGGGGGENEDPDTKEKIFPIDSNRGLVDILWLIDTSGSMREETANVQKNFGSFLQNLTRQTNTRLTLVAAESAIKLSAEASAAGHSQINKTVASTDALVIAKSLLNGGTVQLRDRARFVVVVVTDDNAASVTDANFLEGLVPQIAQKKPALFAFRGDVTKPNCKVAKKGVAYENLAVKTGGQVFDICDLDWTPNFDKLVRSVESIANSAFKIDDLGLESVSKVILDGLVLEPRDYAVIDGELQLVPALISASSKELIVRYKTKEQQR
jgi:hypothetical protein